VIALLVVLVAFGGARALRQSAFRVEAGVTGLAHVSCVVAFGMLNVACGLTESLRVAAGITSFTVDVALLGGSVALDQLGSLASRKRSSSIFAFVLGGILERRLGVVDTLGSGSTYRADTVPSFCALGTLAPDAGGGADALSGLTARTEASAVGILRGGGVFVLHSLTDAETALVGSGLCGVSTVSDVGKLVAAVFETRGQLGVSKKVRHETSKAATQAVKNRRKVAQLFLALALVQQSSTIARAGDGGFEVRGSFFVVTNREYNGGCFVAVINSELSNIHLLAVARGNLGDAVSLCDFPGDDITSGVLDLDRVLVEFVVPFAHFEPMLDFNTTPNFAN